MLQYRNTPDRDTKLSLAMCVFGRPIRDFIPIPPGRYHPHDTWRDTMAAREEALRNRHMRESERWSEHTKHLQPLVVGDHVRIQNQTGPHPLKWDKTGLVIEVRQFDQYVVKVDGSGRVTLRNRKFLRRYIPVQVPQTRISIEDDMRLRSYKPDPPQAPSMSPEPRPKLVDHTPAPDAQTPDPPTTWTSPTTKPQQTGPLTPVRVPSRPLLSVNHDTERRRLTFTDTTPLPQPSVQPPVATASPLRSPPRVRTPTPVTPMAPQRPTDAPRRSRHTTRLPAWHSDYDMDSAP